MLELLKKSMLAGIGLAVKSKEELEEFIRDFVKKEEMPEEEGKSFFKDIKEQAEKARKDLETAIESKVRDLIRKADVAGRDEVAELRREVEELKARIETEKS